MLCAPWLLMVCPAYSANEIVAGQTRITMLTDIHYLRDPGKTIAIEQLSMQENSEAAGRHADIDWLALNTSNINFLYDDAAYWFRFPLDYRADQAAEWVLEIDWPFLDRVALYIIDGAGQQVFSSAIGDQSQSYREGNLYRLPHFAFTLRPHTDYTLYLQIDTTSSVIVPIALMKRDAYETAEQGLQALYGVFFGSLLIMALYNAIVSIFTRDKSYAYYVAYLLAVAFYAATMTGFGQQYLWGCSPWINAQGLSLSVVLSFLLGAFFVEHFLKLRKRNPFAHRTVQGCQGVYLLLALASLVGPESVIVTIEQPLGLLACVLVLAVVGYEWKHGNHTARYFLIAWLVLIIGTCAYTLLLLGLIPRNILTENIQMLGIWIEMLLLSLVLADRINRSRIERLATMQALFETAKDRYETEAQAKARGQFFAKMSHEIRTPIGGVIGIAGLLRETPLSPEQQKYVQTIAHSGESLLAVVNDILDFSKMEAGKLELETIRFNLRQLVDECIDIVAVTADQQKVRFVSAIDDSAPANLLGDPIRIRQILLNLLSNAIKFTEQGEIRVTVSCLSDNDQQADLRFSVQDSGIGLSEEQMAKLFQPFQQADASTSRQFGGTGLGLAICRELVEAMGGVIGVDSQPQQGACFWFRVTLPSMPGGELASAQDDRVSLAGLRVLVAEDNPVNTLVVKGMLERLGVSVQCVENGVQALSEYQTNANAIDAILMDCEMPEMDGFAAAAAIREWETREARSPVTIIALTAHSLGDFSARCQSSGMDKYLMKPPTVTALRESLGSLVKPKTRQAGNG